MAFSTDMQIERTVHLEDDRMLFDLNMRVIAPYELEISASIETQYWANPIVMASDNTIGIHPADEDALVLAVYREMRRYFHAGSSGGVIWWVRWLEPDLQPWIRASLNASASARIIGALSTYVKPSDPPRIPRRYTESAEG